MRKDVGIIEVLRVLLVVKYWNWHVFVTRPNGPNETSHEMELVIILNQTFALEWLVMILDVVET